MATFIEDTEKAIKNSGHAPSDIEFIGDYTRHVELGSWDTFRKAVTHYEESDDGSQDSGYKACRDLIIAFQDGSLLFREGYATTEQWDYLPSSNSAVYDPDYLPPESAIQSTFESGFSLIQKAINNRSESYIEQLKSDGVSDWNIQQQ